jgi:multiple sugar transport system permease protein
VFSAPLGTRSRAARAAYLAAVLLALGVWLLPLLAMAVLSLRSVEEVNRGQVWGWPRDLGALGSYAAVLTTPRMGRFLANSVLVTVPAVVGTLALSSMAGFALAKHGFRGRRLLLMLFVAGNLVPFQVLMIPVRDLMIALHLYDTRWALVAFHAAFQTGFGTLFMWSFIHDLPDAVLHAARLDGAGELRVFRSVILPLVRPALAAVAVLIFTFVWNDYFWALVLVQSDAVRPLTAGIQSLRGMWQTAWPLVAAASLLAAVPPVAVFFAMQRHLVAGLTYAGPGDRAGG